ncbi:hypothetical protein [Plantactinospora soyae]|uniref:Uncharacterized protein n=1 Tax=Plantactinospora soyae TaxID=1544732 RepID=A0A927M1C8_9ACTN|nr:hypothetical protein [Plantactinospora soyae]MBE1485007.1 hypothetical protein [Plantactinospora soyae]
MQIVELFGAVAFGATRSTSLAALVATLASAFSMLIVIGVNRVVI